MRFKIDWAILIVGSKFTVSVLFCFVFEGNFPSTSDLTEGFLRYRFRGLIFGVAYTWRGLFSEFYGMYSTLKPQLKQKYKQQSNKRRTNKPLKLLCLRLKCSNNVCFGRL